MSAHRRRKKNTEIRSVVSRLSEEASKRNLFLSEESWSHLGNNSAYVVYNSNITKKTVRVRISNHYGGIMGSYDVNCIVHKDGKIENYEEVLQKFNEIKATKDKQEK